MSLIFRVFWQVWPSFMACLVFWVVSFVRFGLQRRPGRWLFLLGLSSNALVTLANNGRMPVVGDPHGGLGSVWVTSSSAHRLLLLADHASLWGFSVGDVCIAASLLLWVLVTLRNKARPDVVAAASDSPTGLPSYLFSTPEGRYVLDRLDTLDSQVRDLHTRRHSAGGWGGYASSPPSGNSL